MYFMSRHTMLKYRKCFRKEREGAVESALRADYSLTERYRGKANATGERRTLYSIWCSGVVAEPSLVLRRLATDSPSKGGAGVTSLRGVGGVCVVGTRPRSDRGTVCVSEIRRYWGMSDKRGCGAPVMSLRLTIFQSKQI
jgi:hypothetical protein